MKKFIIIFGLILFSIQALYATITVDGFCYLENATDHSGTKVLFNAVSASAVTDSIFTNTNGSFILAIEEGIYTVHYSHDGWQPYTIPGDIPLFVDTTLDDVTLSSGVMIEVSGPQSGIWSSNNIYQVIGDISVANGDSLIIEPGVTVKFMDYYSFKIYGKLVAVGSEADTIRFTSGQITGNPSDWDRIHFQSGSDSNSIISYSIIDYASNGIYCSNSSPNLSNNVIRNNGFYLEEGGIYCSSSSPTISNNTINNNVCGIYCRSSSFPTINNNTIINNSTSIYCIYSSSPHITNNFISNNSSGIFCNDSSSPTISNNTISNITWTGISFQNSSSPIITNNTISNSEFGITCHTSSSIILNNILYDNSYGLYAYLSPSSLEYNLFWLNVYDGYGDGIPIYFEEILTVNANGDSCDAYMNLFIDPLFVDSLNGDYHLTENSPCIDAGNPTTIYYDPDGTISDIGAFYFDQLPFFPNADFSANITNGIFPLIVDFTDLSTVGLMGYPINEWFWDFNNDGTIDSNEQNPQWTYPEAGLYTVTLTVSDGSNTGTETKVDYITVLEPIDADFEAVPSIGLAPLDVQFTDLSTGGLQTLFRESKKSNNSKIIENYNSRDIVSWEWDFDNDGTIDSYLQNPNYTYSEVGVYSVSLTVSDGTNEDTEIKADYITVGEPIDADFEADPLFGLPPLVVQFTDLSTGGLQTLFRESKKSNISKIIENDKSRDIVSWEWDFNNDGSIDSNEQNPQWIYTEAGLYTVTLKVSDGSNTGTEAKTEYITVGEPIIVDFAADITLGSFPLDVQFTDLSNGGLDTSDGESERVNNKEIVETNNLRDIVIWEWDFDNDGLIDSNEQNPSYIYNSIGYYSVCLTVYDNINNSKTLTKEDYIFVNPDIAFLYQTDGVIESGISLLSEDVIYSAASGDCVYRFNNSGQIEYTLNVNGDIKSATTITPDHNVYIASTDYNLYSFNSNGVSNTGWPLSLGAEATASVASDSAGNIYIGTRNGIFQVVNPNGENIWSYNVGAPIHSSAVISFDNTLYVINTNGRLYAFNLNLIDPQNVAYKWRVATNGSVSSTPALDDINNIYITNENGQLIKINDDGINGSIEWTFESGSTIIESSPIIDSNYNVYFGCSNGKVYSVNDSGHLNWSSDEFGPIKSTGALFESDEIQSRIYIGSDNGKLHTLSSDDGSVLWEYNAGSAIVCPILYDAGKIYFGTINGEILVINDPDISAGTIFRDTSIWSTFQGNNLRTGNQTDNMVAVDPENVNNISLLMQNYPNPINSNTNELKVSFIMKQRGNVTIQLFNIKGQKVSTLLNENKNVGEYLIMYPINELSSGIYFTKMSVDGVEKEIMKVVLLR